MKRLHRRALAFLLLPLLFLLIVIVAAVLGLGSTDPAGVRSENTAPEPQAREPPRTTALVDEPVPRRRRVAPPSLRREKRRSDAVRRVERRAVDLREGRVLRPDPGRVLVPVAITLPNGREPRVARVIYGGGEVTTGSARWRPGAPVIELRPGTYAVSAVAGDHDEYRAERIELTVPEHAAAPTAHLLLAGPSGVAGSVGVPVGEGLPQFLVLAVYEGAQDLEPQTVKARAPSYAYRFPQLAPGPWAISARRHEGGPLLATRRLDVSPGFTHADLELPPLLREEYLLLRVLDPSGAPVDDAVVVKGTHRGERFTAAKTHCIDRGKGVHWVLLGRGPSVLLASLEDAAYGAVSVTSKEHGTVVVSVPMAPSPEVTVRFLETATVEARVTGVVGDPPSMRLFLQPAWAPLHVGVRGDRTDSFADGRGRRRFEGLQPGEYRLTLGLRPDEDTRRWELVAWRRVTIGTGTNEVTIAIPALHVLRVRLPPARLVRVFGDGSPVKRSATAGEDGTAVFERLPAGKYLVWAGRTSEQQTIVRIPDVGEVDFRK